MNGALNPFAVEHRRTAQVFWPEAAHYSEVNSHSRYLSTLAMDRTEISASRLGPGQRRCGSIRVTAPASSRYRR